VIEIDLERHAVEVARGEVERRLRERRRVADLNSWRRAGCSPSSRNPPSSAPRD
jgi:hypothetical protein